MKQLTLAVAISLAALGAPPLFAADNPQQSRMAACNKEATGKTGDERKSFMAQCLADKKLSQQEKMKACNAQAADKTGDDRKAFMSACLKN